jgi:fumiquinazoline A oxidase
MGAGIGSLQGHRGLMLDALESVRIVTADGALINASRTQNSDLFWAIRGAGANFGVVTSATFLLYDATYEGQVMIADFAFPASANQTFWRLMQSFDHNMPSKLSLTGVGVYDRISNQVRVYVT